MVNSQAYFILYFNLYHNLIQAQTNKITGRVVDEANHVVTGATVKVTGTKYWNHNRCGRALYTQIKFNSNYSN
jgi:hypothetical protein